MTNIPERIIIGGGIGGDIESSSGRDVGEGGKIMCRNGGSGISMVGVPVVVASLRADVVNVVEVVLLEDDLDVSVWSEWL